MAAVMDGGEAASKGMVISLLPAAEGREERETEVELVGSRTQAITV